MTALPQSGPPAGAAATITSVAEADPAFLVEPEEWQWSVLDTTVAACELLWRLTRKSPVWAEIQRRTGLNDRVFRILEAIESRPALVALWHQTLPNYYYALLIGRLTLESPIRAVFQAVAVSETLTSPEIAGTIDAYTRYVREAAPLIERWFVQHHPSLSAPPDNDVQQAVLAAWATRRTQLEAYFLFVQPELDQIAQAFFLPAPPPEPAPEKPAPLPAPTPAPLPPIRTHAAPLPVPEEVVDLAGFLGKAAEPTDQTLLLHFNWMEVHAVRWVLTFVPQIGQLSSDENLAAQIDGLSTFQVPQLASSVKELLKKSLISKSVRLTLAEAVFLLQLLHASTVLLTNTTRAGELLPWVRTIDDYPRRADATRPLCELSRSVFCQLSEPKMRKMVHHLIQPVRKRLKHVLYWTFSNNSLVLAARKELAVLSKFLEGSS